MMRYAGANSILQATEWVQSCTEITLLLLTSNSCTQPESLQLDFWFEYDYHCHTYG